MTGFPRDTGPLFLKLARNEPPASRCSLNSPYRHP
jgi:hypothetical protein